VPPKILLGLLLLDLFCREGVFLNIL